MGQFCHILTNLRLQLQNSFFLKFRYCFLFLVWYCLKNMCKSRRKLSMAKSYPLKVQILKIIFFLRFHFMDNLGNYSICMSPQYQNSFFSKLEFLFSLLGSMMSKNICKLRHKLKNAKNLHQLTWSWQKKTLIYSPNLVLFFLLYHLCYSQGPQFEGFRVQLSIKIKNKW